MVCVGGGPNQVVQGLLGKRKLIETPDAQGVAELTGDQVTRLDTHFEVTDGMSWGQVTELTRAEAGQVSQA